MMLLSSETEDTRLLDIAIVWCKTEVPSTASSSVSISQCPYQPTLTHLVPGLALQSQLLREWVPCHKLQPLLLKLSRELRRTHCSELVTRVVQGPPLGRNMVLTSPSAPLDGPVAL